MANEKVQESDMVIVYYGYNDMIAVHVEKDKVLHTRFGDIKHEDLIGSDYGKKLQLRSGYIQLLRFTPELWNSTLSHRTQIMYLPDISVIVTQLDLRPGSIVCEAGTGSGAMTHHLANAVLPSGAVYTFDFHADRVARAKLEFEKHGIGNVVHAAQRDVCSDGFDEALRNRVDALVLDLPAAHRAIRHATSILRPGGRLCTFQPCIEQVLKVHAELTDGPYEFAEVTTCECLLRPWMVKRCDIESFESFTAEPQSGKQNPGGSALRLQKSNPVVAVPSFESRGHTAYLTFATFIRNRPVAATSETSLEQTAALSSA